jgi:hypothetical protein
MKFFKDASKYFRIIGAKQGLKLVGAHIANMMRLVENHLDVLYGRACANEEVVSKIKKFGIKLIVELV